jgi:hypothetical protein
VKVAPVLRLGPGELSTIGVDTSHETVI